MIIVLRAVHNPCKFIRQSLCILRAVTKVKLVNVLTQILSDVYVFQWSVHSVVFSGWPACLRHRQNPLRTWPDSSASVTGKKRYQTTHSKTSRELPCTMRPIFFFISFLRWLDIHFHTSLLHIYDCPWEHFLFMSTPFINWTAVSFFLHVCQNNLWFIIYVIYDRYKLSKSVKRKVIFWIQSDIKCA